MFLPFLYGFNLKRLIHKVKNFLSIKEHLCSGDFRFEFTNSIFSRGKKKSRTTPKIPLYCWGRFVETEWFSFYLLFDLKVTKSSRIWRLIFQYSYADRMIEIFVCSCIATENIINHTTKMLSRQEQSSGISLKHNYFFVDLWK